MNATMVLSLMGGLGLFLFGIKTMGEGLETAAGSRMKHLLEILTRNKLTALGINGALCYTFLVGERSSACFYLVMVGPFPTRAGKGFPYVSASVLLIPLRIPNSLFKHKYIH